MQKGGETPPLRDDLPLQRAVFHTVWSQIFAEFLDHHGFVIGPVTNVHLRNRVTFVDDEVGADAIEGGKEGETYSFTLLQFILTVRFSPLVRFHSETHMFWRLHESFSPPQFPHCQP